MSTSGFEAESSSRVVVEAGVIWPKLEDGVDMLSVVMTQFDLETAWLCG